MSFVYEYWVCFNSLLFIVSLLCPFFFVAMKVVIIIIVIIVIILFFFVVVLCCCSRFFSLLFLLKYFGIGLSVGLFFCFVLVFRVCYLQNVC